MPLLHTVDTITSKQLCEQYLKTAAPVMGCKGAGCAENRRLTERSWQLWEHDPASWGEKTDASLATVSDAALTPSVLTLLMCWPALEYTCSTGPVHDDFMGCTIRKPTCADFMGRLRALLSFIQQEKPLSTGSGIYSTALKRSGGPYFALFLIWFIFDGNSESYNVSIVTL